MKRLTTIIFLLASILLLTNCSPKLGKRFYTNPEDILFQHRVNYSFECFSLGKLSKRHSGILAIVKNELIIQPTGMSSSNTGLFSDIIIPKEQIIKVELSEINSQRTYETKEKIITVQTYITFYCFHLTDADKIYEIILDWYNQQTEQ